jgi:transposase
VPALILFPKGHFAYAAPADMRKSIQGLLTLARRELPDEDPHLGSFFVFPYRRGNYTRILGFDRTGFTLFAKTLERGRFTVAPNDGSQELLEKALRFISDGSQ